MPPGASTPRNGCENRPPGRLDVIHDIEWEALRGSLPEILRNRAASEAETTALRARWWHRHPALSGRYRKPTAIVQCRAWGEPPCRREADTRTAGCDDPRENRQAFFTTSGHFANDAKMLASSNRITLIDGDMLHHDQTAGPQPLKRPAGIRHRRRLHDPNLSKLRESR